MQKMQKKIKKEIFEIALFRFVLYYLFLISFFFLIFLISTIQIKHKSCLKERREGGGRFIHVIIH